MCLPLGQREGRRFFEISRPAAQHNSVQHEANDPLVAPAPWERLHQNTTSLCSQLDTRCSPVFLGACPSLEAIYTANSVGPLADTEMSVLQFAVPEAHPTSLKFAIDHDHDQPTATLAASCCSVAQGILASYMLPRDNTSHSQDVGRSSAPACLRPPFLVRLCSSNPDCARCHAFPPEKQKCFHQEPFFFSQSICFCRLTGVPPRASLSLRPQTIPQFKI